MVHFMRSIATAIVVVLFTNVIIFAAGTPNTEGVNHVCNGQDYDLGTRDGFQETLFYVLHELVNNTEYYGYNYYFQSGGPIQSCYGHGACNGNITPDDCGDCMDCAVRQLVSRCPYAIGAWIQLVDYRARYEQYSFSE